MSEKKLTLDQMIKVDLNKSIEDNANKILKFLKENNISFTEFSNYILNLAKTKKGKTTEVLDKKMDAYKKAYELYFKDHLSNKLSNENKNLKVPKTKEEIAKATEKGAIKLKRFVDEMQHDLTHKKAGAKIQDIINTIVKLFKTNNMAKQNKKIEEEQEPKLIFKKDDVLFYLQGDSIRIGQVLKDSFNKEETILKSIVYDKQNKVFKTLDDLIVKDNTKLSKPFRYKNVDFNNLTTKNKLDLVMGKQTEPIKTINQYPTKVDGIDVKKTFEQDVRFQLKINKKKGIIIPKVIRPFIKQAYGKEFSVSDLATLKKGGVLINDAINKKGEEYQFTLKYDKGLKGVVAAPFNTNYLTNKKGISEKAYVGGNTLDKNNIKDLLAGKPVELKIGKDGSRTINIGFSENSTILKRLDLDKAVNEKVKTEIKGDIKETSKKGTKKEETVKSKNKKETVKTKKTPKKRNRGPKLA